MRTIKSMVELLALISILHMGSSYASEPGEGAYIRDGDTGTLIIKKSDNGALKFQLDTLGANGHMCSVDGPIKKDVGYDGYEGACQIAFKIVTPTKISVEPITDGACRDFCGMRAFLDGEYEIPPSTCTHTAVQQRRSQFLKAYRNHDYKKATALAKSIINECESFIDWVTIDDIRNDLAIAQYHEGDLAACTQTLSDTLAARYSSEDEVKENLPPADGDAYSGVAAATFYNESLCSKRKMTSK